MKLKTLLYIIVFIILSLQAGCNLPGNEFVPSPFFASRVVPDVVDRMSADAWLDWVEKLSGEEPVVVGGESTTIETRFSYAMFSGQSNAQAFEYVQEQVTNWVGADQVDVHSYIFTDAERSYTWKNLIVTLPGSVHPEQEVILSAHLDSIVTRRGNPLERAPGANDNATGVSALLEAVRLLHDYRFERTIKIIFFTGEEEGLHGSKAYVQDYPTDQIEGVINLDMFGFDSTGDRCFEIHAGTLPASQEIGLVLATVIEMYELGLTYDFLTVTATDRSDHSAFWEVDKGAVLVIENFFDDNLTGGCQGVDPNPYYHKPEDTVDLINVDYAFDIARASVAAVATLAHPIGFASFERFLVSLIPDSYPFELIPASNHR